MDQVTKIVIAYDISDDRRRKKIADLLSNYGYRMNYSVFECYITDFQLNELYESLSRLMDKNHDSILIYPLDKTSASKSLYLGTNTPPPSQIFV